ncbi:MAG: preprotein translocase subunit YajC [Verrucomicrobia bacterium]|nr:MAG: preprotein translocase subunit YajC [Verrucomicrobiota bacterium]
MQNMNPLDNIAMVLAQQAPGNNAVIGQILFFGLFFLAMWFLLIAPQRKKQKKHQEMIGALATGDEVVTTGGIHGVITNVKDDRFVVKIAENTKIEVGKGFISGVEKKS